MAVTRRHWGAFRIFLAHRNRVRVAQLSYIDAVGWYLGFFPAIRTVLVLWGLGAIVFFCLPPGISLSATGCPRPKWPENPVFHDFRLLGVQSAKTANTKKLLNCGEKRLGRPDFPPASITARVWRIGGVWGGCCAFFTCGVKYSSSQRMQARKGTSALKTGENAVETLWDPLLCS